MKKERLFTVKRSGWEKGGTQYWISYPLPETEAKKLLEKWRNLHYKPTAEECNFPKSEVKLDRLECIVLEPYKKPFDYADGKIRRITLNKKQYFYQTINEEGRNTTTIFDSNKTPIYRFRGDPHDYDRSGIMNIIKNGRL